MNKDDTLKEDLYTPNCIRTFSGRYINVFDPNPNDIIIEDIAHALAHIPRFGGHLPVFYSVAQHCIMCAGYVNEKFAFEALMHDATEAYLLDIPKPIKDMLPHYVHAEKHIHKIISWNFGVPIEMSSEVKEVDRVMLEFEWNNIMLGKGAPPKIYTPEYAKQRFLELFEELSK